MSFNYRRKDWEYCLFQDVFDIQGGSQPPKNNFIYEPKEGYVRLLQIRDFGKKPEPTYVPKDKVTKFCNHDDIFIARYGASLGRIVTGKSGAYNVALAKIIHKYPGIYTKRFVYFMLQTTILQTPLKMISRSAQSGFAKSDLSKIKLPIVPISEQRAIVTKIENLFASLDKGIADLKKAQEQLKVYRQAVLKKAFEGEFAIHKLGEIAVVSRGKSKHRPRNDKSLFGGKYPFIQTGEIRTANGGTIKKYSNTYSEKGLAQSKLWPKGTLCLTIAANIGETAFLGFDSCFPDSIVGIKPNNEVLSDKYLNFYIQKIKKDIDNKASATAQKNINVRFLNALEIPLPSLKYQKDIVREIESRLSVCDKIEQSITEGLQKSEALRQSILKKAFEGKLLSEAEIEKCKQEADYEPASVLLDKIKKEKK